MENQSCLKIVLCLSVFFISPVFSDNVAVNIDESGNININNGLVNVTFNSLNSDVISLIKNGIDLVDTVTQRTFYFDWNAGGEKFVPTNVTVVANRSDAVHIKFFQPFANKRLEMEYHVQFYSNLSGFYQWVTAKHTGNLTISYKEFRMIYRLSSSHIKQMSNMIRKGAVPNLHNCSTIQDTTWQLPDGYYWSKYDYVGYIRETPWMGMYGDDLGAWVISPSREYHSGGPLKQDLLTQHDTLMCNYLTSAHFGTNLLEPEHGFSKLYGPWLFYLNSGNEEERFKDVERQTQLEISQWPYKWLDDPDYPLKRGTVTGTVTGQLKAQVVLHSSIDEYHETQTKGYLYSVKTDEEGSYLMANVRPGDYVLSVYPLAGQGSENLVTKNVTIVEGKQTIEMVNLPEPENILWSIGENNRRADNFRYSDELRNYYWHTLPPANLTFTIGQSNIAKDWYYAQTHKGTWKIVFHDAADNQNRTLRIAMAAASCSKLCQPTDLLTIKLQISLNGNVLFDKEYNNDGAIYRGMLQSGVFHQEKVSITADLVKTGNNVLDLTIVDGSVMYDAISYQVNA